MKNIFVKTWVFILAGFVSSFAFSAVLVSLDGPAKSKPGIETAIFAGGCFWCTESDFDKVPGVISTTSGYTGGTVDNPTYEEVSSGRTGHSEAVEVKFDSKKVSYSQLLKAYWLSIDPLNPNGQFCDNGQQYRSVIFYLNDSQEKQALGYKKSLENRKLFKQAIVTEIRAASTFYPAEEYHQDYHRKNPIRYNYYRNACGRDDRLKQVWGKK
ncbi:MAG: peptide-methionine (S)-S-oxide reductase MsrA [Arenimonas sp.]